MRCPLALILLLATSLANWPSQASGQEDRSPDRSPASSQPFQTVYSFTLPLPTAGSMLPHPPHSPAAPSPAFLPPALPSSDRSPLAWRLEARKLFSNPLSSAIIERVIDRPARHTINQLLTVCPQLGLQTTQTALSSGDLLLRLPEEAGETGRFIVSMRERGQRATVVRIKVVANDSRLQESLKGVARELLARVDIELKEKDLL